MSIWPYIAFGGTIALLVTIKRASQASVSNNAREWLARMITIEAGDIPGPNSEWAAIMQCVLNRVRSPRYPSTVRGVVSDIGWSGSQEYVDKIVSDEPLHHSRYENALRQADLVLAGDVLVRLDPGMIHMCHPGSHCSPEGSQSFNQHGVYTKKCVGGRWYARWALTLSDPDSTAVFEPIRVGRAIFS